MRIRLVLDLKNIKIPVNYRSILQGVIYNALFDNKDTDNLHDFGYKLGKRKFKLFTFSELYGESVYLKDTKELLFNSTAYFDFSTYKDDLILSLSNYLLQNDSLLLGNKVVKVSSFEILEERILQKDIIEYSTLSPITVYKTIEDKRTEYLHPSTDEFKNSIINNLAQKYFLIYNENIPSIEIIEVNNIKEKRVYFRNNFSIAYHCNIVFKGLNDKCQKIILSTGLGSKNSSGFGMVISK